MSQVEQVQIPIKGRDGRPWAWIGIHLLPGDGGGPVPPLLDRRRDPGLEPGMAGVQLLEGHEYRYTIALAEGVPRGDVSTDRPEIFRPDTVAGLAGRIRPGLYTGTLPVNVFVGGRPLGRFEVEVRASKLDYLSHYRWMLRDLADTFAETIMRRFAPAEARFTPRPGADAPTLYQRFAFLKSIIEGGTFDGAITQILSRPHREWHEEEELRPVGQPIPAGPGVARALARSGPRVPWPGMGGPSALASLPARMPVRHAFETYDTLPNRFVKHVLVQWRNTVADVARALAKTPDSATARRGLAEAEGVLSHLDGVLSYPLFRYAGPLVQPPLGNQVLQKRAGYREMYKLYVQSELAAALAWSGGEDIYRAGQKDVAALYEYWVFVQLAQIVSGMCRKPLELGLLLEEGPGGLDLQLKRGQQRVLAGTVVRRGRPLSIELWYNRTFAKGGRYGSWTRALRPDCSLRIESPGYGGSADELWIHFDAKYRVDSLLEIFSDDADSIDAEAAPGGNGGAVRPATGDLLKMHAYRDAIRRSSGAYVVYPGTAGQVLYRYHEILPGLGAFALRPAADGPPYGASAIRQFISAVMDHAATQVSQHERYRYWENEIFRDTPRGSGLPGVEAAPFLRRPPADTRVLFGYVRSREHYRWIQATGLYNMRADQRTGSVGLHSEQLAAEIVVLYGPGLEQASLWRVNGDPRLVTVQRMLEMQYPGPRGTLYYCLPVEPVPNGGGAVANLAYPLVLELIGKLAPGADHGAPVATTWLQLVEVLAARRGLPQGR